MDSNGDSAIWEYFSLIKNNLDDKLHLGVAFVIIVLRNANINPSINVTIL